MNDTPSFDRRLYERPFPSIAIAQRPSGRNRAKKRHRDPARSQLRSTLLASAPNRSVTTRRAPWLFAFERRSSSLRCFHEQQRQTRTRDVLTVKDKWQLRRVMLD
jgi:hypothetical protein